MSDQPADGGTVGEFSQIFFYRVPRANHDRFGEVEGQLAAIFRKHGALGSDFYVLGEGRIFQGFRDLREVLGTSLEEEVWVEVDHYRDVEDSVRVIAAIGQDPSAGPLFGEVLKLGVTGFLFPEGNAGRVQL